MAAYLGAESNFQPIRRGQQILQKANLLACLNLLELF